MTRAHDTTRHGDLAEALVPVAADLVRRVRGRDRTAIAALLAELDGEQSRALPVVLAAMVPADTDPADLLAWVTDTPTQGPPQRRRRRGEVDAAVVDRAAAGEPLQTTRAEKAAAARKLVDQGAPATQIARRLRVSGSSARALHQQAQADRTSEPRGTGALRDPERRRAWVEDRAACRSVGPTVMFPDPDQLDPAAYSHAVAAAKTVCGRCLVRADCLRVALDLGDDAEHGIWGGTTGEERADMRADRARKEATA